MSVHDLPSRGRALALLAAVEQTPPRHDCPGLGGCIDHPRWRVTVRGGDRTVYGRGWVSHHLTIYRVYPPRSGTFEAAVLDHAEAMDIATEWARPRCQWCGDGLAWVEYSFGSVWEGDDGTQCPANPDGPSDDLGTIPHVPRPRDVAAVLGRTT